MHRSHVERKRREADGDQGDTEGNIVRAEGEGESCF
jgi:hypothetical protein